MEARKSDANSVTRPIDLLSNTRIGRGLISEDSFRNLTPKVLKTVGHFAIAGLSHATRALGLGGFWDAKNQFGRGPSFHSKHEKKWGVTSARMH